MNITFYVNESRLQSVPKKLTHSKTVTGTLRDETSIVDPTILIETEDLTLYNYFYIPKFNRYYFIHEIESVRTDLWRVTGHVDVLQSFKDDLLSSSQYISRYQKNKRPYQIDKMLPISNKRQIVVKSFGDSFVEGSYFILNTMGIPE